MSYTTDPRLAIITTFPRVPADIIETIAELLSPAELRTFALTSKDHNHTANKKLYHDISLETPLSFSNIAMYYRSSRATEHIRNVTVSRTIPIEHTAHLRELLANCLNLSCITFLGIQFRPNAPLLPSTFIGSLVLFTCRSVDHILDQTRRLTQLLVLSDPTTTHQDRVRNVDVRILHTSAGHLQKWSHANTPFSQLNLNLGLLPLADDIFAHEPLLLAQELRVYVPSLASHSELAWSNCHNITTIHIDNFSRHGVTTSTISIMQHVDHLPNLRNLRIGITHTPTFPMHQLSRLPTVRRPGTYNSLEKIVIAFDPESTERTHDPYITLAAHCIATRYIRHLRGGHASVTIVWDNQRNPTRLIKADTKAMYATCAMITVQPLVSTSDYQ